MQQRLIGSTLLMLVLLVACSSSKQSGYTVFFDKPIMLFEERVWHHGSPIGKVHTVESTPANSAKVTVSIDPKFASLATQNIAFFVKSGRLCLTTIAPFGEPLEKNAALPGFTSKMELNLFRLKHLLGDRMTAARNRTAKMAVR